MRQLLNPDYMTKKEKTDFATLFPSEENNWPARAVKDGWVLLSDDPHKYDLCFTKKEEVIRKNLFDKGTMIIVESVACYKWHDGRNALYNKYASGAQVSSGAVKDEFSHHSTVQNTRKKGVIFNPTAAAPEGYINTFNGFSCERIEGDCEPYLRVLRENVCRTLDEYEYILDWMAFVVQNPGIQTERIPTFKGNQGVGKSMVMNVMGTIHGKYFVPLRSVDDFGSKFNSFIEKALFLAVDEAAGSKKQATENLKKATTGQSMLVEPKGIDAHVATPYFNIMMCTDQAWACLQDHNARRPVYFEVKQVLGLDYLNKVADDYLARDGVNHFYDFLMKRNIGTRKEALNRLKKIPFTCKRYLFTDKVHSMNARNPPAAYLRECIKNGSVNGRLWTAPFDVDVGFVKCGYYSFDDRRSSKRPSPELAAALEEMIGATLYAHNGQLMVRFPSRQQALQKMAAYFDVDEEFFINAL